MSACIDLLFIARRKGYINSLAFHLDRGEMEEVQATLQSIQALAGDNLASIRLLNGEGKLIDQVGTLISLQTAGTTVSCKNDECILSVMVTVRPREPRAYRILWVGLDGAGKTTMLHRMKHSEFSDFRPTIGLGIEVMDFEGNDIENVDIAGHPSTRNDLISVSASEAKPDAVVFVVDSSNPGRLYESADFLQAILENRLLKDVPLVILATKQDMEGALTREEIVAGFDLKNKMAGRTWTSIDASAKTGLGIVDLLHFLATVLFTTSK
nr:ADP-ribosylation factor-like protein [Candidatus Sigynarchaeota archaeon]